MTISARFATATLFALIAACAASEGPATPPANAAPPSACGGRIAVTELSPDWATFAIIAESGDAIDVPEASDPSDAIAVKQIAVDRFFVRFARQRGESLGPLQVLERECRDAPLAAKVEWAGGSMVLRRRGNEYVITRAAGDAGPETPLASFLWMANARKPADAGVVDPR